MPINEQQVRERDRAMAATGGALAVVGGFGYFTLLLLHGDLPDQSTVAALEHIAGRAEWPLLKWMLIASVLCWVGAFWMLAHSFRRVSSWVLGHLAFAGITVGATLVLVEYSVMGYGVKNVADAWASSTGTEQEVSLIVGRALLGVTSGLFLSFITWLIGVPFFLMGLAVALGDHYPRWLGWIAVVGGAGAFLSGTGRFLGVWFVPFPLLYGGFIVPLSIWLGVIGLITVRRARTQLQEA
jgi:hypothetical protein